MIQSLLQFTRDGRREVGALDAEGRAWSIEGTPSIRDFALEAMAAGSTLAALAEARVGVAVDLDAVTLHCPIDHADPAHLLVSGTGLTHLGSAEGRDKMHRAAAAGEQLTDSMRMFQMVLEGGKPETGTIGVQPEWFYKGDGSILVDPGQSLTAPGFSGDGGEEPEIAGIYLIDASGQPIRLGFVLGTSSRIT